MLTRAQRAKRNALLSKDGMNASDDTASSQQESANAVVTKTTKKQKPSPLLCSICHTRDAYWIQGKTYEDELESHPPGNELNVCVECQAVLCGDMGVCIACRKPGHVFDSRLLSNLSEEWEGGCSPDWCRTEENNELEDDAVRPPLSAEERWELERPAVSYLWKNGTRFFQNTEKFNLGALELDTEQKRDQFYGQYKAYWVWYHGIDMCDMPNQTMERTVSGLIKFFPHGDEFRNDESEDNDDRIHGTMQFPDSDFVSYIPAFLSINSSTGEGTTAQDEDELPYGDDIFTVQRVKQATRLVWCPSEDELVTGDYCSAIRASAEQVRTAPSSWMTSHLRLPPDSVQLIRQYTMFSPHSFLTVEEGDLHMFMHISSQAGENVNAHILARKISE